MNQGRPQGRPFFLRRCTVPFFALTGDKLSTPVHPHSPCPADEPAGRTVSGVLRRRRRQAHGLPCHDAVHSFHTGALCRHDRLLLPPRRLVFPGCRRLARPGIDHTNHLSHSWGLHPSNSEYTDDVTTTCGLVIVLTSFLCMSVFVPHFL